MSLISALAVYFVIWWLTLFVVLPWGVYTQAEADDVVPGSVPSAPRNPLMGRKIIANTLVSAVFFAIFYLIRVYELIRFDDLLPSFQ
jgi:predicted secreted protein